MEYAGQPAPQRQLPLQKMKETYSFLMVTYFLRFETYSGLLYCLCQIFIAPFCSKRICIKCSSMTNIQQHQHLPAKDIVQDFFKFIVRDIAVAH